MISSLSFTWQQMISILVMQALDVKQGLTHNFASATERDEWIQKEVKSKEASRKKHLQQAKEAQGSD